MNMTPEQLRFLREQRGLTREDLANYLGDCTASTVNKWERGMHAIPSWVADKMFAKMPITFTVQDLAEMYELCREEGYTMSELIQESVRALLAERREGKTAQATKNTAWKDNIISLPENKVAESPPKPPRKTGTED